MASRLEPIVGQWYLHRDKGEMFRVVALDAPAGTVELQNFDGDIEELELDAWRGLDIEAAEPPEDWTGPFDDIETDDLGYTETAMSPQDWRRSLEALTVDAEAWQDARAQDELEEEEEGRPQELYAEELESTESAA